MKKIIISISYLAVLVSLVFIPIFRVQAEGSELELGSVSSTTTTQASVDQEYTFKAKVIKVLEERKINRNDGSINTQQNLLLIGLNGKFKNQQLTSIGIGDFDVVSVGVYRAGDTVYVDLITNEKGENYFFVTDYVRSGWIYFLVIIFLLTTVFIGGRKGLQSLVSLVLSFIVILFFIIPQLLHGADPLLVAVTGSLVVMSIIIYLTDGFNRKSHLAVFTVIISLILTFILAYIFTLVTRLSGFSSEEATLLIGTSAGKINFQGLLLAGILIGAVGVLDDIVLGQIEAVSQIKLANPKLSTKEIFSMGMKVGRTHLGAIVNTLFLTYTGASLPLLMLFYLSPSGSVDFFQVINNDSIATEIVRTLVGSIGLMLSMPISTYLASRFLK